MLIYIVDTFEMRADVDRPAERTHTDFQLALQLVEDVERIAALAVELVDKDNNGSVAHTAHLHKLPRLLLHAFRHVDHNDYTVDSRKCAIRILREILVSGSVENVDFVIAIIEAHHGCRHRDAALFLYLHPVGRGRLFDFIGLHSPCHMDSASKEEKFFGQCCFTGIRVTDDCECATSFYFFF